MCQCFFIGIHPCRDTSLRLFVKKMIEIEFSFGYNNCINCNEWVLLQSSIGYAINMFSIWYACCVRLPGNDCSLLNHAHGTILNAFKLIDNIQ